MRYLRFSIYLFLSVVIISCSPSKDSLKQSSSSSADVTELLADIPADDQEENHWVYSELIEDAPGSIHNLVGMVSTPGYGDDTNARFALNGLAKYVSRSNAQSERKLYERVLLNELKAERPPAVKAFLMEQLELTGSNQAVPVLRSFIGDGALHQSAVHALRSINTSQAQDALVNKIGQTEDAQKIDIIKALGDMEVVSITDNLLPYASSGGQLQHTALYALVKTGNSAAEKAFVTEEGKVSSPGYYLLFARRLAEEGYYSTSSAISHDILSGDYSMNVKSSALTLLVGNEGEGASDQLLSAATHDNDWFRGTSLKLIQRHPSWKIWDTLIDNLEDYSLGVQADVIAAAGKSGRVSFELLDSRIQSNEKSVRIVAIQSMALLENNERALPVLLNRLTEASSPQELNAVKEALLQLPTKPLVAEAGDRLSTALEAEKNTLIEILAARQAKGVFDKVVAQLNGANEEVRLTIFNSLEDLAVSENLNEVIELIPTTKTPKEVAIVQKAIVKISADIAEPDERADAVIRGFDELGADDKVHLYKILAKIGGEKALATTVKAAKRSDSKLQNAALEVLVNWKKSNAISPLFAIYKESDTQRDQVLQGFIRLVVKSKYATKDKIDFLRDALAEASSSKEEILILKGFEDIQSPKALQIVINHFDADKEVKEQALRSAANIIHESNQAGQTLSVLEATEGPQTVSKIEQYMQEINQDSRESADKFTSLFNGKDLSGWTGDTDSYLVKDGQIISREGARGNLFTKQKFSDFVLKFEFKLTPGANNGLGIRSPLEGDPAYRAMELQILDNTAPKYANLEPYQYHGSVYGVASAKRGHLKPVGEWNTQEVIADGSHITVKVNGHTILDTDIEEAGSPQTIDGKDHPGLLRENGHIGFLGHGDKISLQNIRIRDLDEYILSYSSTNTADRKEMNEPPENFSALFNGNNLNGWKGLVGNPESRAKMSEKQLAKAQEKANNRMRNHWSVRDGILYFDGQGKSLATQKKYKDFEMLVDWKIEPGGDSGVYLRGSPQVQIWDITEWPQGSGGLYNNQHHLRTPLVAVDNAIGEWNTMRIKMVGEEVTVHLNNQLVVPGVVMENYWDRDKPIYSKGQIELQSHNTPLYFKNIFIREIPRQEKLFDGNSLTGWERVGGDAGGWQANNGILSTEGSGEKWEKGTGGGWLSTTKTYDDFKLELDYRLPEGGNSGIFLRAPHQGDPAFQGFEIQLLDDNAKKYKGLDPWQYTGSIYDVKAPVKTVNAQSGQWQSIQVVADGSKIKVVHNGEVIMNSNLVNFMDRVQEHPGLKRRSGYIGLQNHNSKVEFRNIKITEIK